MPTPATRPSASTAACSSAAPAWSSRSPGNPPDRRHVARLKGAVMVGRWRGLLALLALAAVWLPTLGNPADLLGVATAVAVGAIVLLLVGPAPERSSPRILVRFCALRERTERSAFLRTRGPDPQG